MIEVKTTDEIDAMLDARGRRKWRQGLAVGAIGALAVLSLVGYKVDAVRSDRLEQQLRQQVLELKVAHADEIREYQNTVRNLANPETGIVANLMREVDTLERGKGD